MAQKDQTSLFASIGLRRNTYSCTQPIIKQGLPTWLLATLFPIDQELLSISRWDFYRFVVHFRDEGVPTNSIKSKNTLQALSSLIGLELNTSRTPTRLPQCYAAKLVSHQCFWYPLAVRSFLEKFQRDKNSRLFKAWVVARVKTFSLNFKLDQDQLDVRRNKCWNFQKKRCLYDEMCCKK